MSTPDEGNKQDVFYYSNETNKYVITIVIVVYLYMMTN